MLMLWLLPLLLMLMLVFLLIFFSLFTLEPPMQNYSPSPEPYHVHVIDHVDSALKRLPLGNIVYNAPTVMEYKKVRTLELILSPSLSIEELQALLDKDEHLESASVRISDRMGADLTGDGFTISTLLPEWQLVSKTEPVRWKWRVTPTEHGTQFLHLALSLKIHGEGSVDTPYVVKTFERTIQVNITVPQRVSVFVGKNWQWLCTTLLFPAVWYVWFRWRKRARGAEEQLEI